MKKLLTILAVIAFAWATVNTAKAQFIGGPSFGSVLTNQNAVMVAGFIRTNFGLTAHRTFPVGAGGVQLFATVGATNALTVTNCSALFELVGPGATNGLSGPTFTWTFPVFGLGSTGRITTNFSSVYVAAQANTALANVQGMRLLYVTNVNSESIWLTNLYWSAR